MDKVQCRMDLIKLNFMIMFNKKFKMQLTIKKDLTQELF